MWTAVLALVLLALGLGWALSYAAMRMRVESNSIVEKINAILPQTQCGQCGYPGCKPYAQAVAVGEADINQCPPGGQAGIVKLAALLGRKVIALNPQHGVEKPKQVAVIDEPLCIGCTLCIQACPVDAILGANKQMHTVIAQECTGCELCVAPCPVDCIRMVPLGENIDDLLAVTALPPLPATVMPCIRCGACVEVCPENLLPQQLYWHARAQDLDKVQQYALFDCTECGNCASVCPSNIPLVDYYRYAKAQIWIHEREQQKATVARQRYEFRLTRMAHEKNERTARLIKQDEDESLPSATDSDKKSAILAAMERVKAKRQDIHREPRHAADLTAEQQR